MPRILNQVQIPLNPNGTRDSFFGRRQLTGPTIARPLQDMEIKAILNDQRETEYIARVTLRENEDDAKPSVLLCKKAPPKSLVEEAKKAPPKPEEAKKDPQEEKDNAWLDTKTPAKDRMKALFVARCVVCHNTPNGKGGVKMSADGDLLKGKPESIVESIQSGDMPKHKDGIPDLTDAQKAALQALVAGSNE